MTPARRWIVACAVAGFVLRAAFALLYWTNQPLTHDEREYLALARSVARGEGFQYPADEPQPGTAQQFGRAPGYPAFLSTFIVPAPVSHVPPRVQIVQAIVGALGVAVIGFIAMRAGGARAGIAAAAIAAIYPPLVWMPSYALSETLYSTLALAVALLLAVSWCHIAGCQVYSSTFAGARSEPGTRDGAAIDLAPVAGAALLTGLAILTRPAMIFFLPFGAAWLWRKRSWTQMCTFVIVTVLVVLPWTVRNHHRYGRWMIASEGGVTFWTGNHPLAAGDGDLAANPQLKRAELAFRAAHPGLTPEQLEPLYYRDAFAWIAREPGKWLALMARKVFFTVVPAGPSYAVHSSRYVAASVVSYVLVLAAAMGGWRRWRVTRTPGPEPLWLMAAATIVAGLIFFPQERFRLPVVDPGLIVAAALLWSERTQSR